MVPLLALLHLTGQPAYARPERLPQDLSHEKWFEAHCVHLSNERMKHYADVASHRITYAWRSELGYLWDWERGDPPPGAAHYCVRMALYGLEGNFIQNTTMLCIVTDRNTPLETWTFGNGEIADLFCPLSERMHKAVDVSVPSE